jgi:CheY-like chemotaxis protein
LNTHHIEGQQRTDRDEPRGTFRVLLVEDNAFVSELFRHAVLKLHGELVGYESHDLMTARTGHEALRLLEDRKPDMVILDHYLPGLTGCSLVRRMRSMPDHQRTPIVMISMGGDEVRREAQASGVTLYIDKPVQLMQLLDTLRTLTLEEASCA